MGRAGAGEHVQRHERRAARPGHFYQETDASKGPDTLGAGGGEEDEEQEDHLGGPDVKMSP